MLPNKWRLMASLPSWEVATWRHRHGRRMKKVLPLPLVHGHAEITTILTSTLAHHPMYTRQQSPASTNSKLPGHEQDPTKIPNTSAPSTSKGSGRRIRPDWSTSYKRLSSRPRRGLLGNMANWPVHGKRGS